MGSFNEVKITVILLRGRLCKVRNIAEQKTCKIKTFMLLCNK